MGIFKRLRDLDVVSKTHFLKVYCWTLFPLLFMMLFAPGGFWTKLITSLLGALAATLVVVVVTGYLGRSAGILYSGGGKRLTLREQLEGNLTQARVSKTHKDFASALATLETILARDPDFPEALLLKAQVLWEGFGDGPESRKYVMKVLHLEKDTAGPVYRWAGELYKEINRKKRAVN